jgi:hypothetical protein
MPEINVCMGCHMFYVSDFEAYQNAPVSGALETGMCGICGEETGIAAVATVKQPVLEKLRDEAAARKR